jgi:hypothetical protein
MVVGIRSLSGDFSPRLVDFCRDDPRYENYLLVEERRVPAMAPAASAACINC